VEWSTRYSSIRLVLLWKKRRAGVNFVITRSPYAFFDLENDEEKGVREKAVRTSLVFVGRFENGLFFCVRARSVDSSVQSTGDRRHPSSLRPNGTLPRGIDSKTHRVLVSERFRFDTANPVGPTRQTATGTISCGKTFARLTNGTETPIANPPHARPTRLAVHCARTYRQRTGNGRHVLDWETFESALVNIVLAAYGMP